MHNRVAQGGQHLYPGLGLGRQGVFTHATAAGKAACMGEATDWYAAPTLDQLSSLGQTFSFVLGKLFNHFCLNQPNLTKQL